MPRTRNEAHRLIEEAMLAANVCAADFIARAKHPALYRVHEGPTPEKKDAAAELPEGARPGPDDQRRPDAGRVPGDRRRRPRTGPTRRRSTRCCCARCSRRSTRAINSGHFGLAYEAYTHFTSPIRRYPDLLVHRVIKALLHGKRYHAADAGRAAKTRAAEAARKARQAAPKRPPPRRAASCEAWEAAGAHCSANERRADEASRDVEAWLKCRYMREHLGEEFGGTVSAVTSFGLFVTLDALYVEGLVHITELGGEYFRFDEVRQELRGERTGMRYAVGTRVRVQVSRVDLDGRKIDFRMVREGEDAAQRAAHAAREGGRAQRGGDERDRRAEGGRSRRQGGRQGEGRVRDRARRSRPSRAGKSAVRKIASGRSGARGATATLSSHDSPSHRKRRAA